MDGSTIALVNPAAPASPPATTYAYDPSGAPRVSGALSNYPFLYEGMEQEFIEPGQFFYTGNGAFYSSQLSRGFSITGAQGTSGPGGPGPDRRHHKHRGHGGGGALRGAAINGHTDVASMAADAGGGGGDYSNDGGGGSPSSLPAFGGQVRAPVRY